MAWRRNMAKWRRYRIENVMKRMKSTMNAMVERTPCPRNWYGNWWSRIPMMPAFMQKVNLREG